MTTDQTFKNIQAARGYFMQFVGDLDEEQLLRVPPGTNQNVLWNLGHIVYSNDGLVYAPSGAESPVPKHYGELYKGGTSPATWTKTPDVRECLNLFKTQNKRMYEDAKAGKFDNYKRTELAPGYALESFEDAVAFNLFHEGIHQGMVMTLRKLMGLPAKH